LHRLKNNPPTPNPGVIFFRITPPLCEMMFDDLGEEIKIGHQKAFGFRLLLSHFRLSKGIYMVF